jgi:hypothetical protein
LAGANVIDDVSVGKSLKEAAIKRIPEVFDEQSSSGKRKRRSETFSTDHTAFIHEGSCECAKSKYDLFSVPATQTSIESVP